MSQSKRHSLLEAFANVFSGMFIGFSISQLATVYQHEIQIYIWSGFTWQLTATSNVLMTTVLTFVSLVRGYIWRRVFNYLQSRSYGSATTKEKRL